MDETRRARQGYGTTTQSSRAVPDLIKRLRTVEQKDRDQERRNELEFIENGPYYIGFDRDAAIEEFKRKWVR